MTGRIAASALLAIAAIASASSGTAPEADASSKFFERMLTLAGEWQGTFEWTGGRSGSGSMRARYTISGAGSALVEDLMNPAGLVIMSTVYHLDGEDLRMSHYCAARNQPRLKARRITDSPAGAQFEFVDVTGTTHHGYVEAFRIEIVDADHIRLQFTFGGGPPSAGVEHITLERARPPSRG